MAALAPGKFCVSRENASRLTGYFIGIGHRPDAVFFERQHVRDAPRSVTKRGYDSGHIFSSLKSDNKWKKYARGVNMTLNDRLLWK